MRKIAVLLSLVALSSNAQAQQSRYFSSNEILGSFAGRTMLWEDYKTPDKPPAVVHYSLGNRLSILYDGKSVPNDFVFDGDGSTICWRQRTVCRSFLYDGGKHVYVVNPSYPDDRLAEVTHVTEDRYGTTFQKIVDAENDPQPPAVAEAPPSAPAPSRQPGTDTGPHFSPRDVAIGMVIIGLLAAASSGGGGSSGSHEFDAMDAIRHQQEYNRANAAQ